MNTQNTRDRLKDIVNGGDGKRTGGPVVYDLVRFGVHSFLMTNEYLSDDDLREYSDKQFEKHIESGTYLYCNLRGSLTPEEYRRIEEEGRQRTIEEYQTIMTDPSLSEEEKSERRRNLPDYSYRED